MGIDNTKKHLEQLEKFVNNYKIFVDTCCFMRSNFDLFRNVVTPILKKTGKQLIVPARVYDELIKISVNENKQRTQKAISEAREGLGRFEEMHKQGIIDVRGEDADNFTDNVFMTVFTKHRMQHKLLLITHDRKLANDIEALNNIQSNKGYVTIARRIDQEGFLRNFDHDSQLIPPLKKAMRQTMPPGKNVIANRKGKTPAVAIAQKQVAVDAEEMIVGVRIPLVGETVTTYNDNTSILLREKIGEGGEGIIYATNNKNIICKIYKQERLTRFRLSKLEKMIETDLLSDGICWPIDMVQNADNKTVGFIMERAEGVELRRCLFGKPQIARYFPTWTKTNSVELCLTILEKIDLLHSNGIILGDINPMNIMVVNSKKVYFVDTDSYQIDNYPCAVGTLTFTAPEIQKKDFKTFLRTQANENYAVAVLLFMIMLPGKSPYAHQGGGDTVYNQAKLEFAYPLGEKSTGNAPEGPWRYCWSHMTYELKAMFYNTFAKEGKYNTPNKRLTVHQWHESFAKYHHVLSSGIFIDNDPLANDIFPTRFKREQDKEYEKCRLCGKEFKAERLVGNYCVNCLNETERIRCTRCGTFISYSNRAKLLYRSPRPTHCPSCKANAAQMAQIYARRTCVDCDTQFTITNTEEKYFRSKSLELPKRCHDCRGKKRTAKQITQNANYSQNQDNTGFIGTAVRYIWSALFK
jgi:serine/threonine protein kinase